MKLLFILAIVLLGFSMLYAQAPPIPGAQPTPGVAELDQQLQEVGCKAERQAASQTIVQLRSQIDSLTKQLNAKDPPPKSGATKH